jgi:hypothetical protein
MHPKASGEGYLSFLYKLAAKRTASRTPAGRITSTSKVTISSSSCVQLVPVKRSNFCSGPKIRSVPVMSRVTIPCAVDSTQAHVTDWRCHVRGPAQ